MILDKIKQPNDIHSLSEEELRPLAEEIRGFLIESLSKTGGHLASNLGVIELTIALHRVCDLPTDKIIWDVGHQSYTHKILTGRMDGFEHLRQEGGMSGFPKREESSCDSFDTGHSSTSISAALGMAWARELKHENFKVFAVIGDGSLTGGMAYEALNNVSNLKKNMVIVLNDNEMSISKNVGGLAMNLAKMRTSSNYTDLKEGVQSSLEKIPGGDKLVDRIRKTKSGIKQLVVPGMVFEEMGIMYLGPVDGSDIQGMEAIFREAVQFQGPVIVHVITKKGNGFIPAERHPSRFHGTAPYDVVTGLPVKSSQPTYTDVFGTVMRKLGERDERVVAITAAMGGGCGLTRFAYRFPDRYFDVGIAEQHAVTFAAGLAAQGIIPVFAVYSSFLQRGFDQVLHDVCLQNLHVIFAIDRAGFVGADGETHQGVFDLSYLSEIPGMTILAPKNKWELSDMMKFAASFDGPIAVRYPKGTAYDGLQEYRAPIVLGKTEPIFSSDQPKSKGLVIAVGSMVEEAKKAQDMLAAEGISFDLANARFVKPLDVSFLRQSFDYEWIITLEENVITGGFGSSVEHFLEKENYSGKVITLGVPDRFIHQGSVARQRQSAGIDAASIAERVRKLEELEI